MFESVDKRLDLQVGRRDDLKKSLGIPSNGEFRGFKREALQKGQDPDMLPSWDLCAMMSTTLIPWRDFQGGGIMPGRIAFDGWRGKRVWLVTGFLVGI